MTKKELETKVINAQAAVAKRRAIAEKHLNAIARLQAKGASEWDIRDKRRDYEESLKKIEEAEKIAANWEKKLGEHISRDAFIEANAPQVVKDFLEKWKAAAARYFRIRREGYIAYRDELRADEMNARREALRTLPELEREREILKDREPTTSDLLNLFPWKAVDAFLKTRGLDHYGIREKLAARSDGITDRLVDMQDEAEREAWLDKTLEEEKKAKLADLIGRINAVVGTIRDASRLYIAENGNINGTVIGTEGKAKVETIGAGGYNIVCFHFRTLVHEIKE